MSDIPADIPSDPWFNWMLYHTRTTDRTLFGDINTKEKALEKLVFRRWEINNITGATQGRLHMWYLFELWEWRRKENPEMIVDWVTGDEVPVWHR